MKKTFLKLLAVSMLVGCITACGDDPVKDPGTEEPGDPETPETPETPEEPETPKDDILTAGENEEIVSYNLNVSDDLTAATLESDLVFSKFTIKAGTQIRNRNKTWTNPDDTSEKKTFSKSIKLGSSSNSITVSAPGRGRLSVYIQNGSSGVEYQKFSITDPSNVKTDYEFAGTVQSNPVAKVSIDLQTAGDYVITRPSGTVDIFLLELQCVVEKSVEVGFEIANQGITDYLEGQEFDSSSLVINSVFGNGRRDSISLTDPELVIDSSAYNKNIPGEYSINIKYKNYDIQTYKVKVYELNSLEIGRNAISKTTSSAAGNSEYVNNVLKQVYRINDTLSLKGLSVKALATYETSEKEFMLSNYTVSSLDTTTAGKKTVNVTYSYGDSKTKEIAFDVYVVDVEPCVVDEVYQVKVDPSYVGTIGAVVDNHNMFTTIQQALDYLGSISNIATKKKVIEVAPGTYKEKLDISIPNLTLKGSNPETTIIEWDSLYGLKDESGFVHETDSTATVALRDDAIGSSIEGITISNFWNSQEVFDEKLGANYSEHRALALLVQADQFVMKNCRLLGYQDTLELFTGRQYIVDTYIQGVTDFIFGTNNTTYFKGS